MTDERQERFRTLYQAERARVVAYVLRRTVSAEDAADVVAEIFTIAWQRLDDVPVGPAGLLWLYVTARNVLANHRRRIERRSELLVRLRGDLKDAELHVDPPDEESLAVSVVLASLPEADREILMLSAWEGLHSAELGRVLGCSATAARIRLHRARGRLAAEMSQLDKSPKQSMTLRHIPNDASLIENASQETPER